MSGGPPRPAPAAGRSPAARGEPPADRPLWTSHAHRPRTDRRPQPVDELGPRARDKRQPDEDQQRTTDPGHPAPVPAHPGEDAEQPPEAEPEREERQPEPEAVRGGERDGPPGLPGHGGQAEHGGQGRPQARGPGQSEDGAQYRRADESRTRQPAHPELAPQSRYQPGEGQPEQDDERP